MYASEYRAYAAAKHRCNQPSARKYASYGGRGIEFRFKSFIEFLDHIGLRPNARHSLDRINNDGHYEIGNVRWVTMYEQSRNRRSTKFIEVNGRRQCVADWEAETNLTTGTVLYRIKCGWNIQDAVSTPHLFRHQQNRA